MFLRFRTQFINEYGEPQTGVFQALGHLIRSDEVFDHDLQKFKEVNNWFSKNLDRPKKFQKHSNKHKGNIGISWFKDSAKEHLKKMHSLLPIFENYGIQVEIIKRENPGYKIFEDEFQVVTIAHGKDKSEVF